MMWLLAHRCRANMAHIRQSRPGSGLGIQIKVHKAFNVVPFSLGSGRATGCACRKVRGFRCRGVRGVWGRGCTGLRLHSRSVRVPVQRGRGLLVSRGNRFCRAKGLVCRGVRSSVLILDQYGWFPCREVRDFWCRGVGGFGCRVRGVRCRGVRDLFFSRRSHASSRCRVLMAWVWRICLGCRVQGAGCRVQGAGCRVQGAG